jgi:glycosyltransferase involved in cell wall biosynthesis
VLAQTVEVEHLYKLDSQGRGPGAIRNELLAQVQTPYVTFLDADDWLEPNFAERCLRLARPEHYVYTDWFQDGKRIEAPDKPWCNGTWHLVTAVVPTALAKEGFDDSLTGMEDTDFYMRLIFRGHCGVRVPEPLVHYRAGGGRGHGIHATGEVQDLKRQIDTKYGGVVLACCGDTEPMELPPAGEPVDGDVLVMALWRGNRRETGRVTGRQYPRLSYPRTTWVDPRDAAYSPHLWARLEEAPKKASQ